MKRKKAAISGRMGRKEKENGLRIVLKEQNPFIKSSKPTFLNLYFANRMNGIMKFLAVLCCILCLQPAAAQTIYWESPETEQLYKTAKEALARGAIKQAVVLFQQVEQRQPDVLIVKRDLAQALLLDGEAEAAARTIQPLIDADVADEAGYQIAGAGWMKAKEPKKAKRTLEAGIKKYPNSGMLYHELGKYYEERNDAEYALDVWLDGIKQDPNYHLNYYEAARTYANTSKPEWTIIYGEIFVNKESQTPRSYEIRKAILEAYKSLFTNPGSAITDTAGIKFDDAIRFTLLQAAPTVSDGFTPENLTMLRTRFVMDWLQNFSRKYAFSLVYYLNDLLKNGQFDAYNQWLFGKVENAAQFEAWKKFHPEAIPSFEKWKENHPLQMRTTDFYNPKNFRNLFSKKK